MGIRAFAVNKTPGDDGFVDEFNSIVLELAGLSKKALRIDLRTFRSGTSTASKAINHGLGVVPDFIWAVENPPSTSSVPLLVTKTDKEQWTNRTFRFRPNKTSSIYYICVFALT